MRISLLIFVLVWLSACKSNKESANSVTTCAVTGKVTQTSQYCGGARPTKEIEDEMARKKPYQLKMYIRKSTTNDLNSEVVAEINPDAEGNFKVFLAKGRYCVVREFQLKEPDLTEIKKNENFRVSEDCFREKWAECYKTFEVTEGTLSGVDINIHHSCFVPDLPCVQWNGPMPP